MPNKQWEEIRLDKSYAKVKNLNKEEIDRILGIRTN